LFMVGPGGNGGVPARGWAPAAYGFRLAGPLPSTAVGAYAVDHWPQLEVAIEAEPQPEPGDYWVQRPDGMVCLNRDLTAARLPGTPATPLSDLVHPVLGTAASLASQVLGEETLHAGAFSGRDGAWVVL